MIFSTIKANVKSALLALLDQLTTNLWSNNYNTINIRLETGDSFNVHRLMIDHELITLKSPWISTYEHFGE